MLGRTDIQNRQRCVWLPSTSTCLPILSLHPGEAAASPTLPSGGAGEGSSETSLGKCPAMWVLAMSLWAGQVLAGARRLQGWPWWLNWQLVLH